MRVMPRRKGSVTEHRGRWRVRLCVDGKMESLGIYDTRHEAEGVLAAALEQLSGRTHATLASFAAQWMDAEEIAGKRAMARTDRPRWKLYAEPEPWAHWPIADIRARDIREWMMRLNRRLARQTVCNALSIVRRVLQGAVDAELIPANPAVGVRVPKRPITDDPWDWLRADELAQLLACERVPEWRRLVYTIAAYTGLRAGELWGLRWGDVDWTVPELTVRRSFRDATKTGRIRRVPLLPPAEAALRRWRELAPGVGAALVWPASHSGCRKRGNTAHFARSLRAAGVRSVRFHDLRHTCGSHLVQGTWTASPLPLAEVGQWLGHSSIRSTERYAHLSPDGLRRHLGTRATARDTCRSDGT